MDFFLLHLIYIYLFNNLYLLNSMMLAAELKFIIWNNKGNKKKYYYQYVFIHSIYIDTNITFYLRKIPSPDYK